MRAFELMPLPCCFLHPQGMAVDVEVGPNDEVCGIKTYFGITFKCRAAVLTTGTFMNGTIWVGRQSMSAGRCADGWDRVAKTVSVNADRRGNDSGQACSACS